MSSSTNPTARRTQAQRVAESSRRLLDAAVELIGEQGWERTTAAEIGLRAGYSRAIVHLRYGSKESLLEAILRRDYERGFIALPAVRAGSGLDQVLARLDRLEHLVATDARFMRAMFILNLEAVGPATTIRPRTARWLEHLEETLSEAVRVGQCDGSIRKCADPLQEARAILGSGLGLTYRWALVPDSVDMAAEIAHWREQVRRQLRAD